MNTNFRYPRLRHPRGTSLLGFPLVAGLLLVPLLSQSQTLFGSGGLSNTAPSTSNLAFGFNALFSNTTGYYNTANGFQALMSNTSRFLQHG